MLQTLRVYLMIFFMTHFLLIIRLSLILLLSFNLICFYDFKEDISFMSISTESDSIKFFSPSDQLEAENEQENKMLMIAKCALVAIGLALVLGIVLYNYETITNETAKTSSPINPAPVALPAQPSLSLASEIPSVVIEPVVVSRSTINHNIPEISSVPTSIAFETTHVLPSAQINTPVSRLVRVHAIPSRICYSNLSEDLALVPLNTYSNKDFRICIKNTELCFRKYGFSFNEFHAAFRRNLDAIAQVQQLPLGPQQRTIFGELFARSLTISNYELFKNLSQHPYNEHIIVHSGLQFSKVFVDSLYFQRYIFDYFTAPNAEERQLVAAYIFRNAKLLQISFANLNTALILSESVKDN